MPWIRNGSCIRFRIMARKTALFAVFVSGAAALASARALYRIDLQGSTAPVLAKDQPVQHGSVVLFHRYPDGRLTSVPREIVSGIGSADAAARASASAPVVRRRDAADRAVISATPAGSEPGRPLAPGEAVLLGPTGDGSMNPAASVPAAGTSSQAVAGRAAIEAQVFPGDPPGPSVNGAAGGMAVGPNGYPAGMASGPVVVNPTLNGAATSTSTPVPNTSVGPNGFPATTTTGPQSGTQPINPNGFPATTTTGPQSGARPIDSNGFPSATQPAPSTGTSRQSTTGRTTSSATSGSSAKSAGATGTGSVKIVPATASSPAVMTNGESAEAAQSASPSAKTGTTTGTTSTSSKGTASAPASQSSAPSGKQ